MLADAWRYLLDGSNWEGAQGITTLLLQQLLLTVTALVVAAGIGLPVALWLGHLGRGGVLAINVSNIGRAVPTFAVLVLLSVGPAGTSVLGPYGRAGLATLVALVLFALPPIITNAYVAVREVDADVVEAARGMGMSGAQVFGRVELPLAAPLVTAGLRLALVQVWATATIAALVAGPGLGRIITDGFYHSDYGEGFAGAIVVAVVALLLELLAAAVQRTADPVGRGRRRSARTTQALDAGSAVAG
ncbi:MAG: ABC transporter permease [Marmoricola sp.]